MSAALIFAASFGLVLCLGVQQLNVQQGRELAAVLTSVLIGLCNLALLKLVPAPTDLVETLAFLAGGPAGIVAAMRGHPRLVARSRRPS